MRDTVKLRICFQGRFPVLKKNQEEKPIKDLSELCAELKNKGIEFALPEREIRPGVRMAMVKDLDGNKEKGFLFGCGAK